MRAVAVERPECKLFLGAKWSSMLRSPDRERLL
jgi:hypothetical protein